MLSRSIDGVDETVSLSKEYLLTIPKPDVESNPDPIHLEVERKHKFCWNKVSKESTQNVKWEGAMTFVGNK